MVKLLFNFWASLNASCTLFPKLEGTFSAKTAPILKQIGVIIEKGGELSFGYNLAGTSSYTWPMESGSMPSRAVPLSGPLTRNTLWLPLRFFRTLCFSFLVHMVDKSTKRIPECQSESRENTTSSLANSQDGPSAVKKPSIPTINRKEKSQEFQSYLHSVWRYKTEFWGPNTICQKTFFAGLLISPVSHQYLWMVWNGDNTFHLYLSGAQEKA